MTFKLGIVGVGKIARDQHLPVLGQSPDFTLVAAASRNAIVEGVANYTSLAQMLDAVPDLQAVSLCTPAVGRAEDARRALERGLAVMLEKPPTATLAEAQNLIDLAKAKAAPLFFTWHSRHAASVAAARDWLADRQVKAVNIAWMEDIRVWHPGQEWILEAGGLGVFDPAINALSIATAILPQPFALRSGRLVFPENRQAPIAANLTFQDRLGAPIAVELDFLKQGAQRWDIEVETDAGMLRLSEGGARMSIDGQAAASGEARPHGEYEGLYRRFAELIAAGETDADVTPLRHVADAFLLSRREIGPRFEF